MNKEEYKQKLDLLFEYYNTYRTSAEQERNLLRLTKEGRFNHMTFSPSDRVKLEHLEKLVESSNQLFPFTKEVSDFKKLLEFKNEA